jgi:photosystem II stability/assembly factor-like uncharacterized protein
MRILHIFLISLFFLVGASNLYGTDPCNPGKALYSDEYSTECLQNIENATSQGMNQSNALKFLPDKWHSPTLKFRCVDKSRINFTDYSVLEFYVRSPSSDPGHPEIHFRNWKHNSRSAKIRKFIAGNVIDDTYRLVRIPLADLATDSWDLGNVESLVWNADPEQRIYYIDNIVLRQTEAPFLFTEGNWAPYPESNSILRLTFSKRWNEESARKLENYTISSTTDPSYASSTHPREVGLHYRVESFSPSGIPRIPFSVFVQLPEPLKNGNMYSVRVQGITDEFCNQMQPAEVILHYDENRLLNTNIKVNQEGYLPKGPKIGYVGGYLGDLRGGAWAVGDDGAIFSWKQSSGWKKDESIASRTLRSVSGLREDDIFCVGDGGIILHWNGKVWDKVNSPSTQDLFAVHFGPTGIGWAVGVGGLILRYENGSWRSVPSPSKATLRGVWTGPGDRAWAVGDNGTILKWNGQEWLSDPTAINEDLYAIIGDDRNQLWTVGGRRTVLFHKSGRWSIFQTVPATTATLRSVMVDPGGRVWIGGDQGLLWKKSESGNSGFEPQQSGTKRSILTLARQHARKMWAGGSDGTLLSFSEPSLAWHPESSIISKSIRSVFTVPYGALRLPNPALSVAIFEESSGRHVTTVPLKLEAANWHLSGEDLYSFDFSTIVTPGIYRARIPGLGLSDPIKIGDDALNRAAYASSKAFYYQRCGTPLTEPYAEKRFCRPIDHEYSAHGRKIDAAFHESLPLTPLYAGEKPGAMMDGHGGWHDAGDFGKYVPTAAAALWYLFTAYDLEPLKFTDGSWKIPESGNGVPDLLDEAKWELEWLMRMQRPDGGVYHKLTSQKWFEGMPHDEATPRYVFEVTTHDTASAAAVFACASRLWNPYDKAAADLYLDRAKKAWDFLQQNPKAVPYGGFHNPPGNTTGEYRDSEDLDNRLWAAAELYRTTGSSIYRDYFESWWEKNRDHPRGWNEWQHFYKCAYWAYFRSAWPDGNAVIRKKIRENLIRHADEKLALTYANPYRNGARLDAPEWIGWGAFTQSTKYAFLLYQAWSITADEKYLRAALLNLDAQLGANPLSICFITGLGTRSPQDPLHHPSLHDGVKEPVPGLPVFGPAAHLPNNQPYYIASQKDDNSFPPSRDTLDPYPILRRYIDAHQLVPMSEFTIVNMAVSAAVFHLLMPARYGTM